MLDRTAQITATSALEYCAPTWQKNFGEPLPEKEQLSQVLQRGLRDKLGTSLASLTVDKLDGFPICFPRRGRHLTWGVRGLTVSARVQLPITTTVSGVEGYGHYSGSFQPVSVIGTEEKQSMATATAGASWDPVNHGWYAVLPRPSKGSASTSVQPARLNLIS